MTSFKDVIKHTYDYVVTGISNHPKTALIIIAALVVLCILR